MVDARRSEVVPGKRHASSTLALATFHQHDFVSQLEDAGATGVHSDRHKPEPPGATPETRNLNSILQTESTRMGQCSTRPHKPGLPGATPGSATFTGRVRKLAKRSR